MIGNSGFTRDELARLVSKFIAERAVVKFYQYEYLCYGRVIAAASDGLYVHRFDTSSRKFNTSRVLVMWSDVVRQLTARELFALMDSGSALIQSNGVAS